jgi:hypothetical protein
VPRSTRVNVALTFVGIFMGIAIVLNPILLFAEDTSPGWPVAVVILLGGAGAALLSQRRDP